MKKILMFIAVLMIVGGCSKWQNPNLVDPAQRNKILAQDKAFCNQQSAEMDPIGAETDDAPPEPTTYEAEFSENYSQANTFEKCMKQRGWHKK